MKASEQAFVIVIEAFELVAQDEAENMSIVQEIMLRSTDYLRRIIALVESQCRTCAHTATVSLWKTTFGGSLGKIHKVVVRKLWRKVRLEATEQAFGRTNRVQC